MASKWLKTLNMDYDLKIGNITVYDNSVQEITTEQYTALSSNAVFADLVTKAQILVSDSKPTDTAECYVRSADGTISLNGIPVNNEGVTDVSVAEVIKELEDVEATIEDEKEVSITSNGTTIVTPTSGKTAMKRVTASVNVPMKLYGYAFGSSDTLWSDKSSLSLGPQNLLSMDEKAMLPSTVTKEGTTDYAELDVKGKIWKNFTYGASIANVVFFKGLALAFSTTSGYYGKWTEDFVTWTSLTNYTGGVNNVLTTDGEHLVILNSSSKIFISTDGKTCTELALPSEFSSTNQISWALGKLWVYNNGLAKMYVYEDWTTLTEVEGWTGGTSVRSAGGLLYTDISSKHYWSDDQGGTWTEITIGGATGNRSSMNHILYKDSVWLLQTSSGSGASQAYTQYYSSDGKAFTSCYPALPLSKPISCIALGKFWALSTATSGTLGLYYSTNGATWTQVDVPNINGMGICQDSLSGNEVCLVTQSSSVRYYTEDGQHFYRYIKSATNTAYRIAISNTKIFVNDKTYTLDFKETITRDSTKDLDFAVTPGA